jgi:hypothetical protein
MKNVVCWDFTPRVLRIDVSEERPFLKESRDLISKKNAFFKFFMYESC